MEAYAIHRVAVIGAGQMGGGIAEVAATHGLTVALADASFEHAERGRDAILQRVQRVEQKGKLPAGTADALSARIRASEFDEALATADLMIEAATENQTLKLELFERAGRVAPPTAILASNTSSLSISRLAAASARPELVVGMHFMNPVPLMKLVELVVGVRTSAPTLDAVKSLAARLGKTVIVSQDRPGFLVNRILLPLINEACFALEHGVGSANDIDTGARLGLNHPLGPLELADLIGLDTVLAIAEVLHRDFGDDKYRPSPLLRNFVAAGWLGRKSGQGFYRYDATGKKLDGAPALT